MIGLLSVEKTPEGVIQCLFSDAPPLVVHDCIEVYTTEGGTLYRFMPVIRQDNYQTYQALALSMGMPYPPGYVVRVGATRESVAYTLDRITNLIADTPHIVTSS